MSKKKVNISKFRNRDLFSERYQLQQKNILNRKIKDINSKLNALKRSDYYDVSGAVESLKTYTDNDELTLFNKSGFISKTAIKKANKNINLVAINKAIEDFKLNRQSSVNFLENLYAERRNELAKFTDNEEWASKLTKRQLKNIYKMFDTKTYEKAKSQLDSLEIFTPYVTALSEQWTEKKFVDTILVNSGQINDLELRNSLKELYNSSIKGKLQYAKKLEENK